MEVLSAIQFRPAYHLLCFVYFIMIFFLGGRRWEDVLSLLADLDDRFHPIPLGDSKQHPTLRAPRGSPAQKGTEEIPQLKSGKERFT